ncbi:CLUMA_CG015837, isoform A [Clunio marinus]|uniref:CLUMA_CG015837, isoform A n=1 Tax=Clunio marinus TaxID=568069 RepID=A0A1J1IRK8_9DIPT|nr:CLUMA_CG015837, isoform A [Clunio marinus]
MRMDNSSTSLPRFNKCCFFFGLRSGVLIFVSIEALFWGILSFVAVYSEVKYIRNTDIPEFTDDLERDWYYYLIFEHPRDTFNERVRTNLIVLNLVLAFIIVLYLIFTLLLIIGISKRSKCFFVPYLVFDVFFLILTLVLGIVGMFFRFQISKLCIFFFFIKFYFAVCVYSLFKSYSKKSSDRISIHSAASQHLTAVEESPTSSQKPGLGEAPLAVAV